MTETMGESPLMLPVASQASVVRDLVIPLLKRTGITVNVAETKEGLTLALVFTEPPEFDGNSFGTDRPDNAALWWELKDGIERARAH